MTTKKEFVVNEYISLKLEEGNTYIYIKGEKFQQCLHLFISNPRQFSEEKFNSIDEIADHFDNIGEKEVKPENMGITPEEMFWGHCSNIQAWVEHDYDTRLIDRYLAFPILKRLVDLNAPKSKEVLKNEIFHRLQSNYAPTILYLINNNFLNYLSDDEIKDFIKEFLVKLDNNPADLDEEIVWEVIYNLIKMKKGNVLLKEYMKKKVVNNSELFNHYLLDYLILFDEDELYDIINHTGFFNLLHKRLPLRDLFDKTSKRYTSMDSKHQRHFLRSLLNISLRREYTTKEKKKKIEETLIYFYKSL